MAKTFSELMANEINHHTHVMGLFYPPSFEWDEELRQRSYDWDSVVCTWFAEDMMTVRETGGFVEFCSP
jgi:hypothetical protein